MSADRRGGAGTAVPLAFTPMDPLFRRMVAVSIALHAAAFVVGVLWAGYRTPTPRFLSVTVVDLVGGQAFAPEARPKVKPAAEALPPRPEKAAKETPPAPAPNKEREAPPPEEPAPARSRPPETYSVAETLQKMRERKASTEQLRETVVALRREKAARSAIRQVGERVAHRIDLSSVAPPAKGASSPSPPSGLSGSKGQARVSPENLAYFRLLDEKIRENWTAPVEMEDLMVQLRIVIEKNGQVSQVRMEKTSGNTFFDDSVLRAIKKASPLPVPPEQLRGSEDHYEIGFRFWGAGGRS